MNRRALNLVQLLVTSLFLLSACSGEQPTSTGTVATTPTPSTTPSTAPSTATTSSTNQPSPPPASVPGAAATTATRSGWWIRIDPALTTAQVITFQIGTDKLNREEWRVWRQGDPADFDVPANYLQAPRLYIRGNVTPINKFASLCMMYKTRGVEHMEFNDDDSDTKTQTDVDFKCR